MTSGKNLAGHGSRSGDTDMSIEHDTSLDRDLSFDRDTAHTAPPQRELEAAAPADVRSFDLFGLFRVDHAAIPVAPSPTSLDMRIPADVFRGAPRSLDVAPAVSALAASSGSARDARRRRRDPGLLEPGSIIDKYRIEELLGLGGFSAVYRATHLLLDAPVALKLLRRDVLKRRPDLLELLCEEAKYAAKINHPNVARVFDITRTKALTYIVMEYVEGSTLARTIQIQGTLPFPMVLRIGINVVQGLKAGLDQGLVHRDIKPANIMLGKSGDAKIVDLGLALLHSAWTGGAAAPQRRTGMVGTQGYISPEQMVHPDRVDFRADMYSLGVTLYHALAGRLPFVRRAPSGADEYGAVRLPVIPSGPPRFVDLLARMLEQDPRDRPESYDEMLEEMRALVD